MSETATENLPDYAPVPKSALGPALNEQGYYVGRVERNLYWITDGTYQSAFLTTSDGVVLLDAPPTIGNNIQRAVDEIASANGVSNKVNYLIYSHHHADHAGASSLFDKNVVRIGHEETRRLLLRDDDPTKPPNEETFQDRRTLEIGGERIDLAWHGANHSPDNIIIHLPDHDTLMLIDIVNPGWAPVYISNLTEDIPGYIEAPANAARVLVEALHRRPPRPARHPRRRDLAPAVHGRHQRELEEGDRHRGSHAVLREVRREHLGSAEGLSRRGDGGRRRTRDREVHRRARCRGCLYREHHVLGDGVDPPRPRLRIAGAPLMASAPIRDPLGDHLLTPQNAALLVIDYQPSQFAAVRSMDPDLLLENIISTVKTAKAFGLPIVHSTVNVASGRQQPTVSDLAELLDDYPPIDRTTLNSWEDADFLAAVRATGRRKLILCALWTEICMTFPALDAFREGYDVYPVVDAIGGTSEEAHRAGLERVIQAGAHPVSWVALACELQRDWAREETVADVIEIVLTERLLKQ